RRAPVRRAQRVRVRAGRGGAARPPVDRARSELRGIRARAGAAAYGDDGRSMSGRGLAFKLSLLIVAGAILVLALIFGYDYAFTRRVIVRNVEDNAGNLTRATVNRVAAVLSATEKVPTGLAAVLQHASYDAAELTELLRLSVDRNPEV